MAECDGCSGTDPEPWPRMRDDVANGTDSRDHVQINIESSDEIQDTEEPCQIWMPSVVLNLGNSSFEYPLDANDYNKQLSRKDTVVRISLNEEDVSFEVSSDDLQEVVMQASPRGSVLSSVDSESGFSNHTGGSSSVTDEKKSTLKTHIITGDSRQQVLRHQVPDTWQDLSAEDFADEDFRCYLLCFSCCKQRLVKKVTPLAVDSPKAMAVSHMEFAKLLEYDPPEGRKLFFEDGVRRIDFVLAWKSKVIKTPEAESDGSVQETQMNPEDLKEAPNLSRNVFEQNLKKEGLELEHDIQEEREVQFTKIHASWEVLTRYAEILRIRMPIKEIPEDMWSRSIWTMVKGYLSHLLSPFELNPDKVPPMPKAFTCIFRRDKQYLFAIPERKDLFFSHATRNRIVDYILRRTGYSEDESKSFRFGINRLIDKGVYTAAYPLHEGSWKPSAKPNTRRLLYENWSQWKKFYKIQPLDHIKTYFGERIGLYFAWLGFYTSMLVLPSIIGFIVFIYGVATISQNIIAEEICDKNNNFTMCPLCNSRCPYWPYSAVCADIRATHMFDNGATVFFTCFMSLWGTVFLELWKRKQASLQFQWNLLDYEKEEEPPRPEYLVKLGNSQYRRKHKVTGVEEPYLPFWRRRVPIYLGSVSTVIFMSLVALAFVFGVIAYRMTVRAALYLSENPLIYNNAGIVTSATAACLNLLVILILNYLYDKAAVCLTDMECHRTQSKYDYALNFKIYILKFVNFYSSLIYIAFFKSKFTGYPGDYNTLFGARQEECQGGCLMELCLQLAITFVGKQLIQNNLMEIFFPKLKRWLAECRKKPDPDGEKKELKPWEKDYLLEPVGSRGLYEEYMEMLIQFGFVTLFVAAFPLAPLCALLNNVIEIRADAGKFTKHYRRPVAITSKNIGVWYSIMYGIAKIAIISNAFIIAFTSSFIQRLVYKYAYSPDYSYHGFTNNSLSYFNISDFEPGTQYIDTEGRFNHVEYCRYPAYREPYWSENKYDYTKQHWNTVAAQFAFIVVYQNIILVLTSVISHIIPDMPSHLECQHLHEKHLVTEMIVKTELERARSGGAEKDTYRSEGVHQLDFDSVELETFTRRRKQSECSTSEV